MSTTLSTIVSSDERLWRAVIAGDTMAFQKVVERYQGSVSGVAYNVVGEFAASQDVAQETFWAAWKSRTQLREPQRLGGWLCGIARNLANEWQRKHRRDRSAVETGSAFEPISPALDPIEQSISNEEEAMVWNSLEEIGENYREVMVLFYRQGQSVAEVAAALELSEDAVKQRLSRGRDMLREQIATQVEGVLVRSRPGRSFTANVMAGIAGITASMASGGTASAAALGSKAIGGAASGLASVAAKSALASGAAVGVAGGVLGAACGLGGAWLGTWLPAQMAPTMTERRMLEAAGKKMFRVALIYTLAILASTVLLFVPQGGFYYFGLLMAITIAFVVYTIVVSIATQKKVIELRKTINPKDDPNPSAVKARLDSMNVTGNRGWKGRSYSSRWRLLGLPLIDIQVGSPFPQGDLRTPQSQTARGWIAIGDRARGLLLAVGGYAQGLFAFGGIAVGGVAFGGLSVGVVSLGGLAIGAIALGGGAVGWDAAGGGAIGWHSAAGGFAVAHDVAFGGFAAANDFAMGGQAHAAEANTPAAKIAVEKETLKWMLEWYIQHQALSLAVFIGISVLPLICLPFIFRRGDGSADDEAVR